MAWFYFIIIIGGVALDQLIKWWSIQTLFNGQMYTIIPGFLALTRLNNHGAAYNIFTGQKILFLIITLGAIIVLGYLLYKFKNRSILMTTGLSFLLAGTLGNAIDRLFRGYVVDMIYLNILNLPLLNFVCNIADILITIGVVLLIFYIFKSDD